MEAVSSQQITVKFNSIHVITSHRDKNIILTNIQENISRYYQIIHIQEIGNKLISLPQKTPKTDYIVDLVDSPLRSDWYDSIFANDDKMGKFTTFSAPFILSLSLNITRNKNTPTKDILEDEEN